MEHTNSAPRDNGQSDVAGVRASSTDLTLLLSARDAARAMSVSERTLFTLTKSGDIPAVRIGRAVRYDPRDLRAFVERAKAPGRAT